MELEIGRTIRFIKSEQEGLELIRNFLNNHKLDFEFNEGQSKYFIYSSIESREVFVAELHFELFRGEGYIKIEGGLEEIIIDGDLMEGID